MKHPPKKRRPLRPDWHGEYFKRSKAHPEELFSKAHIRIRVNKADDQLSKQIGTTHYAHIMIYVRNIRGFDKKRMLLHGVCSIEDGAVVSGSIAAFGNLSSALQCAGLLPVGKKKKKPLSGRE